MTTTALSALYQELAPCTGLDLSKLLPGGIQREVGHFNVFDMADLWETTQLRAGTSYPCRSFYKISLMRSRSRAEYADQSIDIEPDTLIFSTPKVSFQWRPAEAQKGHFCLFTAEFLLPVLGGLTPDELPLFRADGYLVFRLAPAETARVAALFTQMHEELASDYAHKYDLLRAYVLELLHLGQKRQATTVLHPVHSAAARLASRFVELLERQFPIESPARRLGLRSASDFAEQLAVHVNHLNRCVRDTTGKTTTAHIGDRLAAEARALLRHTDWNIAEVGYSLGFDEPAHFNYFFKKQTGQTPSAFRLV